jgi:hypothetical protein
MWLVQCRTTPSDSFHRTNIILRRMQKRGAVKKLRNQNLARCHDVICQATLGPVPESSNELGCPIVAPTWPSSDIFQSAADSPSHRMCSVSLQINCEGEQIEEWLNMEVSTVVNLRTLNHIGMMCQIMWEIEVNQGYTETRTILSTLWHLYSNFHRPLSIYIADLSLISMV